MKFIFKNLGPIREAELELGDLTIIAGRNNTGKTYVAYTLYGFLMSWWHTPHFPKFFHPSNWKTRASYIMSRLPDMEEIAKKVMEKGQAEWSADRETMNSVRQGMIQTAARDFSEEILAGVFRAPHDSFENASLEVVLKETFPEDVPIRKSSWATKDEFTLSYSNSKMRISRSEVGREPFSESVSSVLLFELLMFLFPKLPMPFILSSERFGISVFYKELNSIEDRFTEEHQIIEKYKETEGPFPFLVVDQTTGQYALPIRDNIEYTRKVSPGLQKAHSEIYDSRLFNDIKDMVGGSYTASDDDIRFKSKARKGSFDIPLHIASSSVRGLSDLYFFLRHRAQKNQLLIIDEPESHLDTFNQIQLARLLARAVHAGLKVLITTHSDYIVKEINNLLMLSAPFEEKDEVLKELGYSKYDFLKPNSVRAYVAEKNTLTQCAIDRYGINMPVFDTMIDAINRVSSELSVRLKYEGEE